MLLTLWLLTVNAAALSPAMPPPLPTPPELEYTEGELNMFANVVNGEVGGITGAVTIYYASGETVEADGQTLRRIHARVVDNQVHSELFPDSLYWCVRLYWTEAYTGTNWWNNHQWLRCRDAYQRNPDFAKAAGLNPAEYCALLRCEFGPDGFCSYGRRADNGN